MRLYVVDDLRFEDHEKLKSRLDETYGSSGIDGIYWIKIDEEVLTSEQATHDDCKPFFFALELEETKVSAELLVISRKNMRCPCMGIATESQRNWIIDCVEGMLRDNSIIN